eukprot:s1820_g12.t1
MEANGSAIRCAAAGALSAGRRAAGTRQTIHSGVNLPGFRDWADAMDLRFAAEEGDWGDDDAVEEVQAEGEAMEAEAAETRALQKEISATPRMLSGKTDRDALSKTSHVPARPATRPPSKIHADPHTRYFIMKSSSHKNIVLSIEHRVWATPRSNQEKLNEAFRSASHVILVFSVTGSGCFQGYAKMLRPVGSTSTDVFQGFGRAFEVRWLRLDDLEFEQVSIRNPWNENKSVKVSRDGQELPNDVGRQLCDAIDAKVYEGDPSGYIDDSQELETGDPSLRVTPQSDVQPLYALRQMQNLPPVQPVAMQPMAMQPMQWAPHATHVPQAMPVSQVQADLQWFGPRPTELDRCGRSRKRRRSSDSAPPSDWQGSAPSMAGMAPSAPGAPGARTSAPTPRTAPQTWLGASPRTSKSYCTNAIAPTSIQQAMGNAQCSASGCVCPKNDNAQVVEQDRSQSFAKASAALGPAYVFEDGATYSGQWKGNMRHGFGIHVEADGSTYEGQWIEDKAHGTGRLEHSDGATYDGNWRGSMKHGQGTYVHSDGSKYTGDWLNDLQSGNGSEEWSDGATYSGQYLAGRKNGKGKYTWPNGSYFEGQFVDNDIHGYGVYVWTDGCIYKGQWAKQQMDGEGIFEYPDGRKYEGNYVKSQKHGPGRLSWPDGRFYEVLVLVPGTSCGISARTSVSYEPKPDLTVLKHGASTRSQSTRTPRRASIRENVDEQVNPFWSQRVQVAARVEGLRPTTLPLIRATPESLPPVPADEWDQGEQTPRPVQELRGAEGHGDGVVRSQGRMPMAFKTPQSWDPSRTPGRGHGQPEVFKMNGEAKIFNLFETDGEFAHQSACAGIPHVDLLGPLGGDDRRRGKGRGLDQPGDGLRSQGALRLDHDGRRGNGAEQRHPF